MSDWIKELEARAKSGSPSYSEGDLLGNSVIIAYVPEYDSNEIALEGDFTSEQLNDLVWHMRKHNGEMWACQIEEKVFCNHSECKEK